MKEAEYSLKPLEGGTQACRGRDRIERFFQVEIALGISRGKRTHRVATPGWRFELTGKKWGKSLAKSTQSLNGH